MSLSSALLEQAVDQLATLPGVGRRTAMRYALELLRREPQEVRRFADAIGALRERVRYCERCCNISDGPLCALCANPSRDGRIICVVEDIRDVIAVENTQQFKGLYHVLGGIISPMDGVGPDDLHVKELLARIDAGGVEEVVLALGATLEGDTTAFYLYRKLNEQGVRVSLIARGISVGGDLEQVDEATLGRSIMDRKPYEQGIKR